jgi:hypothetical protein
MFLIYYPVIGFKAAFVFPFAQKGAGFELSNPAPSF